MGNVDERTVSGFGNEWQQFDQSSMADDELKAMFLWYFSIFPWEKIRADAQGFDLGCGSGRWAKFVADKVGVLHCIDASAQALDVAKRNLEQKKNCVFHVASVDQMPLKENSMDFGYSLGVLHHVPDTFAGIKACVNKLKPGAPFLLYLYYSFDNKPIWYRSLWKLTDMMRIIISRLPYFLKYFISQAIACFVYYPMVKLGVILEKFGVHTNNFPLSAYKHSSFYTMRTDALDRFGTRLERRFSAKQIEQMMKDAGLENIVFSKSFPCWCAVGYRGKADLSYEEGGETLAYLKNARILFLPKYAKDAASTRYRFLQYMPYLKSKYNVSCEVSPFFQEGYVRKRFTTGANLYVDVVGPLIKRMKAILSAKNYDLVVLHCEAAPYLPLIMERMLKKGGMKVIYDFDDAVFHNYDQHPNALIRLLFKNKIRTLLSLVDGVSAGNAYLATYAKKVNKKVFIVPTVVDMDCYPVKEYDQRDSKEFRIGWLGSPSTAIYLDPILKILDRFCCEHKAKVILMGSGKIAGISNNFEIQQWSESEELKMLLSLDAGIMPLPETPWARGKCGFKLIQYMACGLPVIASSVGVNQEIVEHNINGFLANTDQQWYDALAQLYHHRDLRKSMGEKGRAKVVCKYSVQSNISNFAVMLHSVMSGEK